MILFSTEKHMSLIKSSTDGKLLQHRLPQAFPDIVEPTSPFLDDFSGNRIHIITISRHHPCDGYLAKSHFSDEFATGISQEEAVGKLVIELSKASITPTLIQVWP